MSLRSTWLVLLLGVAAGLALALSATTITQRVGFVWARPTPAAEPSPVPTAQPVRTMWTPQIAFQYYGTDDIDPQFLAEHVDWLMMRYGAEPLRDEILARGYDNVLPQYLLLFQIAGPGPYENSRQRCENDYTPLQNNVMWTRDFCELVHPHEDWFLHNAKGERLYMKERIWNGTYVYEYFMNPGSPGFRAFWIAQVRRQEAAGWRSLYLDNVPVTYAYIARRADNGDGTLAEYDALDAWQSAVVGMLRAIRASFPGAPLWGNVIEAPLTAAAWDRYRPELDGIQEEQFATGWVRGERLTSTAWEALLVRAERTLDAGKGVVRYSQGTQNDYPRMRFGLASYLLIATPDERATFRYAEARNYETLWWYPEYELQIGPPLGPRRREGEQWVRDFACGRVVVDPARRQGRIEVQPCPS
jgi:hypothetical protein